MAGDRSHRSLQSSGKPQSAVRPRGQCEGAAQAHPVIARSALAAVLMTFPSIPNVGAGLFASAGLAGLVLGMAARPTLGNLIAGIQNRADRADPHRGRGSGRRRVRPCVGGLPVLAHVTVSVTLKSQRPCLIS
jgi:hypothetical protein